MKRHFLVMIAILISVSYYNCSNSKQIKYKYSDPNFVLSEFLRSCVAIDSVKIERLSVIDKYPLVTEWKIRRISDFSILYTVSQVKDSIQSLSASLDSLSDKLMIYRDSLRNLEESVLRTVNAIKELE